VGRRLILDTNVVIAYERGTIDRSSLDDDELAIASVSVAEYRAGIELADTASRAAERAGARGHNVNPRCP
jgi:tRNA(fMet)-specific endonuclease VapC